MLQYNNVICTVICCNANTYSSNITAYFAKVRSHFGHFSMAAENHATQRQTAVTAYFTSKQLLLFVIVRWNNKKVMADGVPSRSVPYNDMHGYDVIRTPRLSYPDRQFPDRQTLSAADVVMSLWFMSGRGLGNESKSNPNNGKKYLEGHHNFNLLHVKWE